MPDLNDIDTPDLLREWKVLPDTNYRYWINEFAQVKNLITDKILKQSVNKKGFLKFNTCINYKEKTWVTHNILAKLWLPNPRDLKEVRFKDGNRLNIRLDNLEWVYHHAHRNKAYQEYGNDQLRDYYNRKKKKKKKK